MLDFLVQLFSSVGWEPHGHCFAWQQPLLGVMIIANLLIGMAYFSIPFALIQLVRKRRDLTQKPVFVLFAIFILGCGAGHFVKLWTLYEPVYKLQGWVDAATATASVGTAVLLWPLLPRVLKLPSQEQLKLINEELAHEVQTRRKAEVSLQQTNEVLEFRVQERTADLANLNAALIAEIEERKEVEAALKTAHEMADRERRRLKAVLEALPVGVFIADAQGALAEVNDAARAVWGGNAPLLPDTNIVGDHYKGRWTGSGEPLTPEGWGINRALRGETSVGEMVDIERFDGTRGTILNSAAPIRDAEGEIAGAVAVSLDVTAQQMTEVALRENQARLAGIIDSAMDAIISVDESQNIVVFNHAAEEIFRIPAQDALGQPISMFIPQRFHTVHENHIANFSHTGKTRRSMKEPGTVMARRPNGDEFPIEATISRVDVSGHKIYTVILRDVTQQMQAEAERTKVLQELEIERARLMAIIDQMPSGLSIAEAPSGRLLLHNSAAINLIRHPMKEVSTYEGYWKYGAQHPDGTPYEAHEYPIVRALLGETVIQHEMIYRRGDDTLTVFSVNATPLRDPSGNIIAAISTFEDVSEQKRAEEAQTLLASIVENTEDSVVGKTLDGIVISWNKGAERIYGYAAEEAIGQSILLVFPSHLADEEAKILERVNRGESITDFETERKRADGQIINVSLTVSPVRDVTGQIVGASAITRDITSRVEQERRAVELLRLEQEARIAAEEANELKSEFLGMVSHELRTPLTSIMGFASTLLAEDVTFEPQVQHEFINIINLEAGKLKDLVEQLLDVTRLQAKTLRIQARSQPVTNALDVAEVQLNTITSEHDLTVEVAPDLPMVQIDEKRIGQVMVNLVDNAVKFSPRGTQIWLRVRHDGPQQVRIEVTDQGIGIPVDSREIIFEPFRQVGEMFQSRGAGLGLAICKGLIEAHGGNIWIENREGKGTTVVFTVPIA